MERVKAALPWINLTLLVVLTAGLGFVTWRVIEMQERLSSIDNAMPTGLEGAPDWVDRVQRAADNAESEASDAARYAKQACSAVARSPYDCQ